MRSIILALALSVALALGVATSSSAAITRNPLGSNNGHFTSLTSIPVTLGPGVLAGDVVWVAITRDVQTTVTPPAGYTAAITKENFNSTTNSLVLYYHVAVAGDAGATVTFSSAATTGTWVEVSYTGADTTPTLATPAAQATASSTTATSPTITPTSAADMLLMVYGAANVANQSYSSPSKGSIAAVDITNASTAIVDLLLSSASATGSQTVTLNTAAANAGIQISMGPLAAPTDTATPTATPSATATATTVVVPTPTPTTTPIPNPTPIAGGPINSQGVAGAPVSVSTCASGSSKLLAGNASRSDWSVLPEGCDMRCMLGTTQDVAPPIPPSATAGMLFKSNILVPERTLQSLGSATVTRRMDCCGVSGACSVSTWEE